MKTLSVAVVTATLLALPATAATVQNGSFEADAGKGFQNGNMHADMPNATDHNGNWDIFANVPGWTVDAVDGLELQTKNTIPLTPYHGDYYAELDGFKNSTISQSITLGVGSYTLTFYYSPRVAGNQGTNSIGYGIDGISFEFVQGPNSAYPLNAWTKVTQAFEIEFEGNYDLVFDASGRDDGFGGFIDAIDVSPAAVPIPAAGFMLFGALGGLAALRRKRAA